MNGYLPHVVKGLPEISQNGANMKEYLLVVSMGVYWVHDVEKHGDIVVSPLNFLYNCTDVLPVDLYGISDDIQYQDDMYQCFLLMGFCFNELDDPSLDIFYIFGCGCPGEPTESIP